MGEAQCRDRIEATNRITMNHVSWAAKTAMVDASLPIRAQVNPVFSHSHGGNPIPMFSFRRLLILLALSLPRAMPAILAQSSIKFIHRRICPIECFLQFSAGSDQNETLAQNTPANTPSSGAQQSSAETEGQIQRAGAHSPATRAAARATAIHDAFDLTSRGRIWTCGLPALQAGTIARSGLPTTRGRRG